MAWLFSMGLTGWLVTALVTLLLLWMWKSYRSFTIFSKMGIPTPPPLPFIGNAVQFFKYGTIGAMKRFNEQYGKVYGMYTTNGPALVISDLDMLREILVKQFQHFPNRISSSRLNMKPWKDGLTQLTGDHWKHVRSTLSPTFSSGKMKRMMPGIQQVSMELKDHLNGKASQGEMFELKELCGRFSMDVIGAVAFGMDVSSIQNPQHNFVKQARAIMNPNKFEIFLAVFFGRLLSRVSRWGILGGMKEALDFFQGICEQALKDRQTDMQSQKYHDFLQLLVESEMEGDRQGAVDSEIDHENHLITSDKWTRKGLTKDEMMANSLIFLLAGFETVATTLAFTLFLLAHNPDCMKKAQDELDSKLGKSLVNYETANALSYLEMCINESLRLYPSGFILLRSAAEDVEIKGVKFLKDMGVFVPVAILHKDPEVWPEPEKFDPMRFTPEERAGRHPMSFLPFGMGPRNCIGMRLAQLEVRMALATILQHFTPVTCEKTVYPPRLMKFQMIARDGLWIKLEKRE
ncbi:hypothetical protein ACOMHN_024907 [Nucella lapillus]